jgi:hypothetical protein
MNTPPNHELVELLQSTDARRLMEGLVHARYHLAKAEGSGEEGGN